MPAEMQINTNIYGQQVLNRLNEVNRELMTRQLRLATGRKFVTAGEGPVEISISKELEGVARRWKTAEANVRMGYNLYSIAETGAISINDILTRMSELTTIASSDLLSAEDRTKIQSELQALAGEIDQTVEQTQYRGEKLLSGAYAEGKQIQVGPAAGDILQITIASNAPTGLYWQEITGIPISAINVSTSAEAQQLGERIGQAQQTVSTTIAEIGEFEERFTQKETIISEHLRNVLATRSRIADANMAMEHLQATMQKILQNVGTSALAQANRILPEAILRLLRA